jgi:hypothetical protein
MLARWNCSNVRRRWLSWSGCDPLSTPRPLGPLVDIADGIGGEVARLLEDRATCEVVFRAVLNSLAGRRTGAEGGTGDLQPARRNGDGWCRLAEAA